MPSTKYSTLSFPLLLHLLSPPFFSILQPIFLTTLFAALDKGCDLYIMHPCRTCFLHLMAPEDNLKKRRTVEPETMLGSGSFIITEDYPPTNPKLMAGSEVIINEVGIGIVEIGGARKKLPAKLVQLLFRKNLLESSDEFELEDMEQEHDTHWNLQRASAQQTTRLSVGRILALTAVGIVVLAVGVAVNNALKDRPIVEVPHAVASVVDEVRESEEVRRLTEKLEASISKPPKKLRYTDLTSGPDVLHPSRGSKWIFNVDDESCPYGIMEMRLINMDNGLVGYSATFSKGNTLTLLDNKYVDDPVGDFSDPFPAEKEKAFNIFHRAYAQTFCISLDEAKIKLSDEGVTIVLDWKPKPDKPSTTTGFHHDSTSSTNHTETAVYGNVNGRISHHDTTFLLQFENSGNQYYVHGKILLKEHSPSKRVIFTVQQYVDKVGSNRKDIVFQIMKKAYESLSDSQLKQVGLYYDTKRRLERNWLDFD
jgi:hypothetical protein